MRGLGAALVLVALAACARPEAPATAPEESVVPGTIGIVVRASPEGVTVAALGDAAERSGLRVGDVLVRYNGAAISSPRQFYRLMIDSRPGSLAQLELRRGGTLQRLEVPVRQLDTMPAV